MVVEWSYDEVKAKFTEFVQEFLSSESGTEKTELLPNFWIVSNKQKNFNATIECEFRKDMFGHVEWFAVITNEGEKSYFLLEFRDGKYNEN